MTSSGSRPGDVSTPAPRGQLREHRRQIRRRRQRRRLYPLLGLVVVLLAGVLWVALANRGGTPAASSSPSTTAASTTTVAPTPSTAAPRPPRAAGRPASSTAAHAAAAGRIRPTGPSAYVPPSVTPTISPPLPGEGQWTEQDAWNAGAPSVMTTTYRPDPTQPQIVAYATWIRTQSTQLALYPGYKGPGDTTLDRGPEMVPTSAYPDLLATFNSGFYEADAAGGFFVNGTLYFPMVNGLATVVTYNDGRVDIVDWNAGPTPPPGVVMARQNLALLVDDRTAAATASIGSDWGVTLGGVPAVWRTGLGIDDKGNLMYIAAPDQTAASLAQILIHLGSVRAMQLDINPEWPIFVTYGASGAVNPSLFVPNPNQVSNRFLYPSTKDFFAVLRREPGAITQPW